MLLPADTGLRFSFSGYDREERLRVMLLDPRGGLYPRGTFFCEDGFFQADEDLAFIVVRCRGWRSIDENVPFSEFAWASPAQVRVLGALLFCQTYDGAWVRLYPVIGTELVLGTNDIDLTDLASVEVIKQRLLISARDPNTPPNSVRVPAGLLSEPYSLVEADEVEMGRFAPSYSRIDPKDFVLMRGIQSLVKCDMLACHREFGEESVIATFIALDASFSMVQRVLRAQGLPNPSSRDAATWLHLNFYEYFEREPPDELEKYFEEFYGSRVSTLHPSNRFGDFPFSPTMWDDAIHLRSQLRQIFSFLVHGSHSKDFEDAVAEYHAERVSKNDCR